MQDLSSMLGDIATGTTITSEGTMGEFTTSNGEAQSILDEAQAMVEGQTMPNHQLVEIVLKITKRKRSNLRDI